MGRWLGSGLLVAVVSNLSLVVWTQQEVARPLPFTLEVKPFQLGVDSGFGEQSVTIKSNSIFRQEISVEIENDNFPYQISRVELDSAPNANNQTLSFPLFMQPADEAKIILTVKDPAPKYADLTAENKTTELTVWSNRNHVGRSSIKIVEALAVPALSTQSELKFEIERRDLLCFGGVKVNDACFQSEAIPVTAESNSSLKNFGEVWSASGKKLEVKLNENGETTEGQLPVYFDGELHPGEYTGKLENVTSGDGGEPVKVTVGVRDAVLWPILFILMGVFCGGVVRRWRDVTLPVIDLLKRESKLDLVETQLEKFEKYDVSVDYRAQREQLREQLRLLRQSRTFSLDEHNRVVGQVEDLETFSKKWESFGEAQRQLASVLSTVKIPVNSRPNGDEQTKAPILQLLEDLQTGGQIKMGEVASTQASFSEAMKLASDFNKFVQHIFGIEAYISDVLKELGLKEVTGDDSDVIYEQIGGARKAAAQARARLWKSGVTLSDLPETHKVMWTSIEQGWSMTHVAKSLTDTLESSTLKSIGPIGEHTKKNVDVKVPLNLRVKAKKVDVKSFLQSVLPPKPPSDRNKKFGMQYFLNLRFQRLMIWLTLIIVSALLAITTGLGELYFNGKYFGTNWDYVLALTWGFGTRAVVDSLYEVVNLLRPRFGLT